MVKQFYTWTVFALFKGFFFSWCGWVGQLYKGEFCSDFPCLEKVR